jgi:hypothetical protein
MKNVMQHRSQKWSFKSQPQFQTVIDSGVSLPKSNIS